METPLVNELGAVMRVQSFISPDQIARTVFQSMYDFARPVLQAFAGDLMHDARHLLEFEQRAILKLAMRDRDWFTYKGRINWSCRSTGTDYGDDKLKMSDMEHIVRVQWSFSCDEDCQRLDLWRVVYKCPAEWVTKETANV